MQIPEVIADNWLVGVVFTLWTALVTVGSAKNKENFWLFGRLYVWWRDRGVTAIEQRSRVESALVQSLQSQVQSLASRLDSQEERHTARLDAMEKRHTAELEAQDLRHDHDVANHENELRQIRQENLELMRYVVSVKRWAINGVDSAGADPAGLEPFPDFETWRRQRDG